MNGSEEKTSSLPLPESGEFSLFPFVLTAMVWAVLGALLCLLVNREDPSISLFKWMAILWGLSVLNLFTLAKTIASVLDMFATESGSSNQAPLWVQTVFWGIAKVTSLGILGAVLLFTGRDIPRSALFAGLSTIILVPLFGGFWWSQSQLRQERRLRLNGEKKSAKAIKRELKHA